MTTFQFPTRHRSPDATGFARDAGIRLGYYDVGRAIEIDDPTWTAPRSPEAVLRHEEIHQQLTISTHHGVMTLILSALQEHRGLELRSFEACLAEQSQVQEMCATYGEMAFVQRKFPDQFQAAIDGLPTGDDDGTPYRALFDAAAEVLPLDENARRETRDPRTLMMGILISAAMNTDGLNVLATSPFDDVALGDWVAANSPEQRFAQLVNAMSPESVLELTMEFAAQLRTIDLGTQLGQLMQEYGARLAAIDSGIAIAPQGEIRRRAQAAVAALERQFPGFTFDLDDALSWKQPEFVDSADRRRALAELNLEDRGEPALVTQWLNACRGVGGLHVLTNLPDPGEDPGFSFVCIPQTEGGIPDDIRVRLPLEKFFELVRPFDQFPNVVTFLGDASIFWDMYVNELPAGHWITERVTGAVRLHVHRRMSVELFGLLLAKSNLAPAGEPRGFLYQIGPDAFVAIIDNPEVPDVYAIQKLPSTLAVDLFKDTANRFGVKPNASPDSIPHIELLLWIVQREFRDLTQG